MCVSFRLQIIETCLNTASLGRAWWRHYRSCPNFVKWTLPRVFVLTHVTFRVNAFEKIIDRGWWKSSALPLNTTSQTPWIMNNSLISRWQILTPKWRHWFFPDIWGGLLVWVYHRVGLRAVRHRECWWGPLLIGCRGISAWTGDWFSTRLGCWSDCAIWKLSFCL